MKKANIKIYNDIIWVLTVVLLICFSVFNQYSWGSSVMFLIIGAILAVTLVGDKGKVNIEFSKFHWYIIIFGVFCLLSSFWAQDRGASIEKAITVFSLLICYSILFVFYRRFLSIEMLLKAVVWSGYIVVLYSFASFGVDNIINTLLAGERLPNSFSNINGLALVAAFSIVIDFYYGIYKKFTYRNLLMIPSIIFILASVSRKALVFVVLGIAFIVFAKIAKKSIVKALVLLLVFAVIVVIAYNEMHKYEVFSGIVDRVDSLIGVVLKQEVSDSGDVWRVSYQEVGVKQFLKTPILGVGIDNSYLITAPLGRETYLHNNYIELLACGGIVGLIIYYSIYIYIFYVLLKYKTVKDSLNVICIILALLILIMDVGMVTYYDKINYFYTFLLFLHCENIKYKSIKQKKMLLNAKGTLVIAY